MLAEAYPRQAQEKGSADLSAAIGITQYCGKLASITQSQIRTPMNVDRTTNRAGKALSLEGGLE
jgi:hypothetical protein